MAVDKPEPKLLATAAGYGSRSIAGELLSTTLTPQAIRLALLEAETGDLSAQAELFERMVERDGELDAHLRTRKAGVASLQWQIEPADDSAAAERSAEFAREVIAGIGAEQLPGQSPRGMRAAIFDLLGAIGAGYSVLEIEWRTTKSQWLPVQLHYRPQRWFMLDTDGQSLMLEDATTHKGRALPPLNFIVHSARARSGFRARTSLLRSCVRAFVVRHFGWKDWMGFAEVYGMPMRLGRLREGVSWDSDEAEQLYKAVAAMGMDMAAVIREGNTIEVLDTKAAGAGEIFGAIIEAAAREMTLAILGQTLTSGGEQGGSYALGQVHNQVRWDLIESDALDLDETLTHQLVRPIVHLNLGESAPLPRWHTLIEVPEDLQATAGMVKTLTGAGLRIPASWAYGKFGIPEPAEGDAVLTPPQSMMMTDNAISHRAKVGETDDPLSLRERAGVTDDSLSLRERAGVRAATEYVPDADPLFRRQAQLMQCSPAELSLRLNQDPGDWRVLDDLALEWLAEKRVVDAAAWNALGPAGKQRAWWVSGLGQQPTALVGNELMATLRAGETENGFLERLEGLGLSVPGEMAPGAGQIAAWQARLVHRNNRFSAQNGSQYLRLQRDRDVRPYGQWLTHDPCPICAPLSGNVAPLDGEFFGQFWPPIHHGCRCEVVSVSADEVESEGLRERLEQPDPQPLDADPGWLFHPGDSYYLEGQGGAPATDLGRADADVLAGQPLISAFL